MKKNWLQIILRTVAALILLQTLYFKFSAAEESVYIFTKMGMEPWGRIGSGVFELFASVMLFIPSIRWLGASLGSGIMAGAIMSHVTILGIEVMNDGGYLFFLAILVFVCCLFILFFERKNIPFVKNLFVIKE